MNVLLSPWTWLAGSAVCIITGFVAASGWSPKRQRTTGETIDFTRRRIGA